MLEEKARQEHNTLYRGEDVRLTVTERSADGTRFIYEGMPMLLPLVGSHQIDNLRCALATIEALRLEHNMAIPTEDIRDGLLRVEHPARFERLRTDPVVVLDGAHNPNGLSSFAEAVRAYYPTGDKTLIIGMLADKDSTSLPLLKGLFRRVIATNVANPRALSAGELAHRLTGIADEIEIVESPRDALDKALSYGGDVFICGSLYLASEIRPYLIDKN